MRVRLVGGPMDGEVHDVPDEQLSDRGVIYRPATGVRGAVEYVYRGEGIAEYVAGIDAEPAGAEEG